MTYSNYFYKSIRDNEKAKKRQFVIDVGISRGHGQMAQTIYIPAIADMARNLNVREGAVQSVMGAYLLT